VSEAVNFLLTLPLPPQFKSSVLFTQPETFFSPACGVVFIGRFSTIERPHCDVLFLNFSSLCRTESSPWRPLSFWYWRHLMILPGIFSLFLPSEAAGVLSASSHLQNHDCDPSLFFSEVYFLRSIPSAPCLFDPFPVRVPDVLSFP